MVFLKSNFQVILQPTGGVFCKHISMIPFGFVSYSATPGFYSKIMQNNTITSVASPIGAGTLTINARKASTPKSISQMNIGELSKIINNPLEDKNIIAECEKIRESISDIFFAKIDKRLFKAYGWVPKKTDW